MASPRSGVVTLTVAAAAATSALLYLGTGPHPVWILTWVAPLPVLLLAPRVRASTAAAVAAASWSVGALNSWSLMRDRLEMPLGAVLGATLGPALLFAVAVALYRALIRRNVAAGATLVVPAIWAGAEYLASLGTPNGAYWSLAYTQSDLLPVSQLASVTGAWGITFAVLAVPAGLATAWALRRRQVAIVTLVILIIVLGCGGARLALGGPAAPARPVALVAAEQQGDWAPVGGPRGEQKLADLLSVLRALPPEVHLAVLAEGGIVTAPSTLPRVTAALSGLAAERNLDIVAGIIVTRAADGATDGNYNAAL